MQIFRPAMVLAVCLLNPASAKSSHRRRDVCDVQNNDAALDACGMKKAFGGSTVYPELLANFSPKGALYVRYDNVVVGGAQQLAPNRVSAKPSLSMHFIQGPQSMSSKKFAALGIDYQPDGKLTKLFWLQPEMQVDRNTGAMTSTAAPIIPYKPPTPPQGTGTHEYVVLVFEEAGAGLSAFLAQNPHLKALLSGSFNLEDMLAHTQLRNSLVAGSFFKSTHQ
ncbi:hypothetical protein PTTG_07960 [Puccinia triticina 1-1 BBBD Race 1]|uniref:Phosphatidylethanolamine-binding protein n=2 Tax=Puccinia triticina TaxID=208348 RepID=A0A0C4F4C0_PUCT1|nr:uncharacterized protein PtA15_8A292 [Puccinia triticina]OAV90073.1 hypothetical protein PTTG_07960 [Puccinia triticina 1-1 BBBD Race 1]WAQ87388.1 hypothetical protein PtA15_8A292 [Puccinia triticina]WAR57242.1 hypothetical protein PtB15_8B289 [Puccinia triticina]